MKKASFLTATIFFFCIINQFCSQSPGPAKNSKKMNYVATTPCTEEIKQMLGIINTECEMMKWRLTLEKDDKDIPTTFQLSYTYGLTKQGTRGFKEGATTTDLSGKWTIKKAKIADLNSDVITLTPANSSLSLSFMQPEEGLLHLLNKENQPSVGTAGWSYTLNSTNPTLLSAVNFVAKELTAKKILSEIDTVASFVGRTPCNEALRKLNNIPATGCQVVKCKLILLQDIKTHMPATFIIQTIYVGNADDNRYSVTGKWKMMQGTPADLTAIVYQLQPDKLPPGNEIFLLKAGDNILFFMNKDSHFLIGDEYTSYTLNKTK